MIWLNNVALLDDPTMSPAPDTVDRAAHRHA
jgi:hypothetical protein